MRTLSRSTRLNGIGPKIKGATQHNFISVANFAVLVAQVMLLIVLTQRVSNLDAIIRGGLTGGAQPPTPTIAPRIPDERGQVLGPSSAAVTIVEFSDFECPFCSEAETSVKKLLVTYQDQIRLVYRHFPLESIHPNALRSAEASECAAEQGRFWQMHDVLFANQTALSSDDLQKYASTVGVNTEAFIDCLSGRHTAGTVQQDIADGKKYGVRGTPTFFVNKRMAVGAPELEAAIRQAMPKP